MSDLQPLQAAVVVAEGAAASVIVPAMAWLAAKAWRRSAASRRLLWIITFAMLLALPGLALVAPSLTVIALAAPPPADPAAAPVAAIAADPGPSGLGWWSLVPLAAAVWLAGLAKLGVERLVGVVRLELMRRKAAPWPLPLRLRGCKLLVSEDCPGPMTWGVLRPVIMLPDAALDWPPAKLAIVLRHELAHVRRRDGLAQALALLACALYWPNPLVWRAARALRREIELAADDAVIASGVRPSDYASQLLALASEWRERRLTPTGLAMAAPPALSQRVQSILSTDAIRTGVTAMDTLKLALLGGVATAALTLARPSVAEIPAPAATPQPAAHAAAPAPAMPPAEKPFVGRDVAAGGDTAQAGPHRLRRQGRNAAYVANGDTVVTALLDDAPAATPAPPAPPAEAAPPAPPAPPRAAPRLHTGRAMTPEERAELDRQLALIGPTIDKAIADAHIQETVQRALTAQDAKTREQVARQLAEIGPKIQKAIANAHIHELVAQRIAEIQPRIDEAMARAREANERAEQAAQRAQERAARAAERARDAAERARERDEADRAAPRN